MPLHWVTGPALWDTFLGIVRQLLAQDNVDFNAIGHSPDTVSITPLTMACYASRVDIINLLLTKDGIDVNFLGRFYDHPLDYLPR